MKIINWYGDGARSLLTDEGFEISEEELIAWDVTFPNGTHERGKAATIAAAQAAANAAHDSWILQQWAKGTRGAGALGSKHICPLT